MKMPRVKNVALLETAFAVRKAVFVMDKAIDRALAEKGRSTMMQVMLLRTIEAWPRITQRELAAAMNLTEAAVSRQIDALLKRRLVVRDKIPEARRAMALMLTKEGEKELLESTKVGFSVIERFYATMTETDRVAVRRAFEGIGVDCKDLCGPPPLASRATKKHSLKSDRIAHN